MNKKLPVSAPQLASLLRLTGMPRAIALALAIALVALASMYFEGDSPAIRPATAAPAKTGTYELTGKVVQVSDGDTVNILIDRQTHRIRLASIDAPETAHGSARPGQPFRAD